jgi:integrase
MSNLRGYLADYLRLRRALGYELKRAGRLLEGFVEHLEVAGAQSVESELAISWARLPADAQPARWAQRLAIARGFALYVQTIVPESEVPPARVFAARYRRRAPYLWSQHDICRLLDGARTLTPPLRAATHEALFGLLAVSGMRVGEAIGLQREHVDLDSGVITIGPQDAKLGRQRLVPLQPSAIQQLRRYAADRDRFCPRPRSRAFFISTAGNTLGYHRLRETFVQITTQTGLRTATVQPRMHDLRHSFAVRTLIGWQRSEADVAAQMPALSSYLGHLNPTGTWWYLSATPELMTLAAERLDARFGGQS